MQIARFAKHDSDRPAANRTLPFCDVKKKGEMLIGPFSVRPSVSQRGFAEV